MSTPEQPESPALTRKQMRDIRNTGATPIVTADAPFEAPPTADDTVPDIPPQPVPEPAAAPEQTAHAPLPRAAAPVAVHDLPGADASVDLGVTPLTRRQARQQERIRTASVPVITPEVAAAHAASVAAAAALEADRPAQDAAPAPSTGEVALAQMFSTGPTPAVVDEPGYTPAPRAAGAAVSYDVAGSRSGDAGCRVRSQSG